MLCLGVDSDICELTKLSTADDKAIAAETTQKVTSGTGFTLSSGAQDGSSLTGVEAGVGYTNSSTSVVPGTTNTDLGNLTDASEDAFGIASSTRYDLMDPIGSLVSLDLGAF